MKTFTKPSLTSWRGLHCYDTENMLSFKASMSDILCVKLLEL